MRSSRSVLALFLGTLVLSLLGSTPAPALADDLDKDPRQGDFYTNEEIISLDSGARNRYCKALQSLLTEVQAETEYYQSRLDSLSAKTDSLRKNSISISTRIRTVNSELRELRLRRKSVQSYVVESGDDLRQISKLLYGDPTHWKDIYEANKELIPSEEAELKPGIRLKIPRSKR